MGPGSDSFKQHTSRAPNSHFVAEQTIQGVWAVVLAAN